MIVIGITGLVASGKDTAINYISKKYKYKLLHMSDIMREMAKKEGYALTRDGLQAFRKRHGNKFLAEEIVRRIKHHKYKKVLIGSIRRSEDYLIPKNHFKNMKLINIFADEHIRFERIKKRRRLSDPKTLAEFRRQERNEFRIYDFHKTFSYADYIVDNNHTQKELYSRLDKIIKDTEKKK
jgi:dephospho-CoA kinase